MPTAQEMKGFSVAVINETHGGSSLEGLVEKVTEANGSIKIIAITDAAPDRVKALSSAYEVIFRPVELAAMEMAIEELLSVS